LCARSYRSLATPFGNNRLNIEMIGNSGLKLMADSTPL
jgi:hypothetical protein